ncbi:SpdD-like protein [Streptomyces sp. NPDC050287]|uniref:SpdD-like protein n=1 Tax=Streptomyces sp. NPDC050287 TaxID=3365608 RepID=UPI0037B683BF
MLRPRIPAMPEPTGLVTPPAPVTEQSAPVSPNPTHAPAVPAAPRPTVQLTPGAMIALVVGGTAVVLVVGAVLVSMLLAVAITGASVAVCAVVLRSMLASENKRR